MNLCISHMYTVQRMIYQKWCIINEDELCLKLHSALQFFTHVMTWHLEYFSAIITMSASKRVFLCPSFQVISIYLLHATLSKMLLKTLYILCTLFTHTVWPQQWLQSVDVQCVLTVYKTKQDWATHTQSQTFTLTHIITLILLNIIHTHTHAHSTHTQAHARTHAVTQVIYIAWNHYLDVKSTHACKCVTKQHMVQNGRWENTVTTSLMTFTGTCRHNTMTVQPNTFTLSQVQCIWNSTPPPPPQLLSPLRMSTIISVIKILCYFHADFCFTASAVSPPQNKSEKMNAVSPPQTENEKIICNLRCICVLSTWSDA